MARQPFSPRDFGIDMEKENLVDTLVKDFTEMYEGLSIDELLLHPREAIHFCDLVRRRHFWYDLPDDIILRSVLTRRKNP